MLVRSTVMLAADETVDQSKQTGARTLGLRQSWMISEHEGLLDLKKLIVASSITLEPRDDHIDGPFRKRAAREFNDRASRLVRRDRCWIFR